MGGHSLPNLSAIAKKSGVSRMTVSRALRNARGVDPTTRLKVLAAATELGYRPNPVVSAFMSYVRLNRIHDHADVLAYLTDGRTREAWRSFEVYARFFKGAKEYAESRGYRLEEFWLREKGLNARRLSQILYSRGIRGVVIGPMTSAHAHLNLDWDKFSASAIGYSLLRPTLSRATNDQYGTMLLALRELRRLGYERIGMAMRRDNDARVYYHWSAAFLSHHWRHYPHLKPIIYLPTRWNDKSAAAWVRKARPEVIVSTESFQQLTSVGFKIPRHLGFVNLDWTHAHESDAGVDQRSEHVGGAAVDIVINQINKNQYGVPPYPRTVTLTGSWVPGTTVRKLRGSPSSAGVPSRRKRETIHATDQVEAPKRNQASRAN